MGETRWAALACVAWLVLGCGGTTTATTEPVTTAPAVRPPGDEPPPPTTTTEQPLVVPPLSLDPVSAEDAARGRSHAAEAALLLARQQVTPAIDELIRALIANPGYLDARYALATAYLSEKQDATALGLLAELAVPECYECVMNMLRARYGDAWKHLWMDEEFVAITDSGDWLYADRAWWTRDVNSGCPEGTTLQGETPPDDEGYEFEPDRLDFEVGCERPDGTRHGPYTEWGETDSGQARYVPYLVVVAEGTYHAGKKHGFWIEGDHWMYSRGTYVDGKRHGRWVDSDFGFRSSGVYEHGVAQGVHTTLITDPYSGDEYGLESKGAYVDGKREGVWQLGDESASYVMEVPYRADVVHGTVRQLSPEGTVLGTFEIADGVGRWKTWHTNGALATEVDTDHGKNVGAYIAYADNGTKTAEGTYSNGVKTGTWTRWWDNGQKAGLETYVNGNRDGAFSEWWPNGKKLLQASYSNKYLNGRYRSWHENGQLEIDTTYGAGLQHGKATAWNDNGDKLSEGKYVRGTQRGKWTYWHEDGSLWTRGSFDANGMAHGRISVWHDGAEHTVIAEHGEVVSIDGDAIEPDEVDWAWHNLEVPWANVMYDSDYEDYNFGE